MRILSKKAGIQSERTGTNTSARRAKKHVNISCREPSRWTADLRREERNIPRRNRRRREARASATDDVGKEDFRRQGQRRPCDPTATRAYRRDEYTRRREGTARSPERGAQASRRARRIPPFQRTRSPDQGGESFSTEQCGQCQDAATIGPSLSSQCLNRKQRRKSASPADPGQGHADARNSGPERRRQQRGVRRQLPAPAMRAITVMGRWHQAGWSMRTLAEDRRSAVMSATTRRWT